MDTGQGRGWGEPLVGATYGWAGVWAALGGSGQGLAHGKHYGSRQPSYNQLVGRIQSTGLILPTPGLD